MRLLTLTLTTAIVYCAFNGTIAAAPVSNHVEQEVDPLMFSALIMRYQSPQKEVDPLVFASATDAPHLAASGFEAATSNSTPPSCASVVMPFSLQRAIKFYTLTQDARDCSTAVRDIQSLQSTYGATAYATLTDPNYLADSSHALIRRIVSNYVGRCTRGLQEASVTSLLGVDNQLRLAKNVGLFETSSLRCVGTIIGDHVLTARHCVASEDANNGVHDIIPEDTQMNFTTLSGDKYTLDFVGADRTPLSEASRERDWIALHLVEPYKGSDDSRLVLLPDLATLWQPLILVSFSSYIMALNNDFTSNLKNAVIDISPICTVMATDGRYLFHACQTLAGMSGTPLMVMDHGRLTVIGVHTGDTEKVPTECARGVSPKLANYGVVPDRTLGGQQ